MIIKLNTNQNTTKEEVWKCNSKDQKNQTFA